MKRHSQIQKFISVLMIFLLLIQLTGCVSYRLIPNSDLPDYSKHNHVIHSQNSKYPLENVVVSKGLLSGRVNFSNWDKRNSINVYPLSDSLIKIDTGNILSLPLDGIAKVKVPKDYLPKVYVQNGPMHKNKSKVKEPIGKTLSTTLYTSAGFIVVGSISMYYFKHHGYR